MVAWVVIYRRPLRQSPQSRLMRALPLPASPLNLQLLAFNLPLFSPFRFYSSTFNRFLINVPFPKFFPCHTSENSPVSLGIATDPKTPLSKSCICHTSEPPPGRFLNMLTFNLPTFKRFLNLSPFFSNSSALFCSLLHFFALSKNSTGLFSCDSALFAKNHPGWGWLLPLAMESAQQQRPLTGKASLLFQLSTVDCQPPESHNSLQVVSYG